MECLRYLHENGCPWHDKATEAAASNGHFECLTYLHENGCPWDEEATKYAASYGHLECLKYLHENGCPWNEVQIESKVKVWWKMVQESFIG